MPFIRGFGSWLPARVVTNEELAAQLGCDAAWILSASGIQERRYAGDSESVASMGTLAARDCLARASAEPAEIDLLISVSGTAEMRFPGPGVEIAQGLGVAGVPVLELPMPSAGSIFGVVLAAQLSPCYRNILVVAAEKMSSVVKLVPDEKNTAILFGDGAGAALMSRDGGAASVVASALHSDGSFAKDLSLDAGGHLHMNGQTVILQSARKIPEVIKEALQTAGLAAQAAGTFVMHQANRNLIVRVARALGVPDERFFCNIERYGNTSSASMLIAAAEWWLAGGFEKDEHMVLAGFGAGFHWGAAVLRRAGVPEAV